MSPDLLTSALSYSYNRWYVFPCRPRDKRPLTPNGFKDASAHPDAIREWWSATPFANIGIALEASGLIVLDVDGPEGVHPFRNLGLPPTFAVKTGRPEGGGHHYYRLPADASLRTSVLAPKLDLRASGAYVIAPPSVHPSGAKYVGNDHRVATLTAFEIERIRQLARPAPTPLRPTRSAPRDPSGDPLKGIDPPSYCWLLTGRTPNSRGKMPCPLHDDWDGDGGSCHFYPTAEDGWYCFGCLRGGDIYSFAQALWDDEPFPNLRLRLLDAVRRGGGHA